MSNGKNHDEELENIGRDNPINMEIHCALKSGNEDEEHKNNDWAANMDNILKAHILRDPSMADYMSNEDYGSQKYGIYRGFLWFSG